MRLQHKLRRSLNAVYAGILTVFIEFSDTVGKKYTPYIRSIVPTLLKVRSTLIVSRSRCVGRTQGVYSCVFGKSVVGNSNSSKANVNEIIPIIRVKTIASLRISIKVAVPTWNERSEWGDFHFAECLSRALQKLGHVVRIDSIETWYSDEAETDDAVVVLRGLTAFRPRPDQITIMWLISHPDKVHESEMCQYDHIFVASESYAVRLSSHLKLPVTPLLQCTDPQLFYPTQYDDFYPKYSALFVGATRGEFRPSVRAVLASGLPLVIVGSGWSNFVSTSFIESSYVPYKMLCPLYHNCNVLLSDHWQDMRENGFFSNRLFDAVASGTQIVSERMDGLEEIFGDSVIAYENDDELVAKVLSLIKGTRKPPDIQASMRIRSEHTFERRGEVILNIIEKLMCAKQRRAANI